MNLFGTLRVCKCCGLRFGLGPGNYIGKQGTLRLYNCPSCLSTVALNPKRHRPGRYLLMLMAARLGVYMAE